MDNFLWKLVIIIDILAFVVSLVGGILSGSGWGIVFIRVIASIAVFTVFALIVGLFLGKLFPDLISLDNSDMDEVDELGKASPLGSHIDIITDDDFSRNAAPAYNEVLETDEDIVDDENSEMEVTENNDFSKSHFQEEDRGRIVENIAETGDPKALAKVIQNVINMDEKS